jgi:fermentation-respiration switch protein FrsA (DUF1100 family)
MEPHRVARAALVVAIVAILPGCGDDDAAQETTGPYAVGTRSLDLVDEARPTPAYGGAPERPTRTVTTDVWYPAAGDPSAPSTPDAPEAEGPFPVIVFNHGQQGDPQQYTSTFELWTRAGYVVAAPRHPITVTGGPGGHFVDDIVGEVTDVGFVIDSLGDSLGDLVDLDHLAVAGHSSGAVAAYGTGFNTCCHDDRVDAVLAEAFPALLPIGDGTYADDLKGTPLLMIHGTADVWYPLARAKQVYTDADPPKVFMTIDGADHSKDFREGPTAAAAATAALAFFDFTLKDRDEARDALVSLPGVEADLG